MEDEALTPTLRKILESMKRGEKCSVLVKPSFITEDDKLLQEKLGEKYDATKDLSVQVELDRLVKVDDWFKDKSTIKRTLLKGKGSSPNIDSAIGVYMKIKVND